MPNAPKSPRRSYLPAPKERNTKETQPEYHTTRWRKLRLSILIRDNYLCVMCKAKGIYTPASIVDHVIPVKKHDGNFWDASAEDNLQSLCKPCHDSKTGGEG